MNLVALLVASLHSSNPRHPATMRIAGSCACSKVSYTVDCDNPDEVNVTWCFCKTCQRQSGAPFIPFADFARSSISWSQQPEVWKSSKIAERYFCKDCGSIIGMQYPFEENKIGIACGTIKEGRVPSPSAHIFLKDKPSWFAIPDDNARRWDSVDDGFVEKQREWRKAKGISEDEDLLKIPA